MRIEGAQALEHLRHGSDAKEKVGQELEASFLRMLLKESGLFQQGGSAFAADLAVDAIADLVAQASPLGVAEAVLGRASPAARPTTRLAQAMPSYAGPASQPHAHGHEHMAPADRGPSSLEHLLDSEDAHISSHYGHRRDPFTGTARFHQGVDIAAAEGTAIRALGAGTVESVADRGGYGLTVEVRHEDGTLSRYAHTSEILVAEGERVEAGQAIAKVGSTGRSTGPHLHFELIQDNVRVDPTKALKAYGIRADRTDVRGLSHSGQTVEEGS